MLGKMIHSSPVREGESSAVDHMQGHRGKTTGEVERMIAGHFRFQQLTLMKQLLGAKDCSPLMIPYYHDNYFTH